MSSFPDFYIVVSNKYGQRSTREDYKLVSKEELNSFIGKNYHVYQIDTGHRVYLTLTVE
jgi:hypothetical protein